MKVNTQQSIILVQTYKFNISIKDALTFMFQVKNPLNDLPLNLQ